MQFELAKGYFVTLSQYKGELYIKIQDIGNFLDIPTNAMYKIFNKYKKVFNCQEVVCVKKFFSIPDYELFAYCSKDIDPKIVHAKFETLLQCYSGHDDEIRSRYISKKFVESRDELKLFFEYVESKNIKPMAYEDLVRLFDILVEFTWNTGAKIKLLKKISERNNP